MLIREDVGGCIGIRWTRAHRSGNGFDTGVCERLLEAGRLGPPSWRTGAATNAYVLVKAKSE